MRGNTFGKMISMTSFGESHGVALGVIIDGVPPGLNFCADDLQAALDKRAPGKIEGTTSRLEPDRAEVLSGIMDGKTLGTPIAVIVKNTNQRSKDYDKLQNNYRPGHADKTTMQKYGIRDHRGGGRSSGRETLARVIAGYFASLVMPKTEVKAFITKLGPFEHDGKIESISKTKFDEYHFPGTDQTENIKNYLLDLKKNGESRGGKVTIIVENCPAGLGEPAFDKLKADLAKAVLSIGACVAFSFGLGEQMADLPGSVVSSDAANFGGIEGGISSGERLTMNCVFKPTSTIGDKAKEGRHDPCIIPRAIPVVEAMVRFVLADHYLRQKAYE